MAVSGLPAEADVGGCVSADYREVTHELLDHHSKRLLPCPFCGRDAVLDLPPRKHRLVARCSFLGRPPCRVRPRLVSTNQVIRDYSQASRLYGQPFTWMETVEVLIRVWNSRAPAVPGAASA